MATTTANQIAQQVFTILHPASDEEKSGLYLPLIKAKIPIAIKMVTDELLAANAKGLEFLEKDFTVTEGELVNYEGYKAVDLVNSLPTIISPSLIRVVRLTESGNALDYPFFPLTRVYSTFGLEKAPAYDANLYMIKNSFLLLSLLDGVSGSITIRAFAYLSLEDFPENFVPALIDKLAQMSQMANGQTQRKG